MQLIPTLFSGLIFIHFMYFCSISWNFEANSFFFCCWLADLLVILTKYSKEWNITFIILGVPKPGLEYQRISIDRSKLSEDEAFEHAIDMISSRQMGFRKAADFFQVSKWKLYKTARKRGIYAEIKKHNQAHVSFQNIYFFNLSRFSHFENSEKVHWKPSSVETRPKAYRCGNFVAWWPCRSIGYRFLDP